MTEKDHQAIEEALRRLIVAKVEFKHALLLDVVDFLRRQSCIPVAGIPGAFDLDQRPSPGLSILLLLPPGSLTAQARITWSLENVSIGVALDELARAVGLEMHYNPSGVYLCPPPVGAAIEACGPWPEETPSSFLHEPLPVVYLPSVESPSGFSLN
jgi:hypothetical protein